MNRIPLTRAAPRRIVVVPANGENARHRPCSLIRSPRPHHLHGRKRPIAHTMNLRGGYNRPFRSADFSNGFFPHICNPLFRNLLPWVRNGFILRVASTPPNPRTVPRRRPPV